MKKAYHKMIEKLGKAGIVALASAGVFLGSFGLVWATSTFIVQQGGTGQTSFTSGNLLYGSGTNGIQNVATTTANCSGTASCPQFVVIGSSPVTITGSGGGGSAFPFTPQTWGNSTTTTLGFFNGFISSASSTFPTLGTGAVYTQGGLLLSDATTSTSVAYQDVWRDGNANVLANNFIPGVTSTVSGGGTVVMTPASTRYQILTGTSNHTYQLPNGNASGMNTGATFDFNNNSTGILTVTTHGGITVASVPAGGFTRVILTDNSTSEGLWETHAYLGHQNASGLNSLGIGTTSPLASLTVSDNTANVFVNAFLISSSTSGATTTLFKIDNTGAITTSLGTGCVNSTNGLLSVSGSGCTSGTVTQVSTDATLTGGPITTTGTLGIDLTHPNTWTGLQQFQGNASTTQLSAYRAYFGGTATSTFTGAGYLGIGTSTPQWMLNIASSTAPQITIGAGDNTNPWSFRAVNNFLYLATSSPVTFATSTASDLTIDNNGWFGFGATSTPGTQLSIAGIANFAIATSSLYGTGGMNINAGCFAIRGVCLNNGAGTVTSVATDATLTGGPITTTGTLGIALSHANTWSGLQQFQANASSTQQSDYYAYFGATATTTITGTGFVGIASSSPWAPESNNPTGLAAGTPFFSIGSSTFQNLLVDSNGRVGIGTTSPWAAFSIDVNKGLNASAVLNALAIGSSTQDLFALNQYGGVALSEMTPSTSTTMVIDWNKTGPLVNVQIGTSATTIFIINATTTFYAGSRKMIEVCNPGNTAGAITWKGIEWAGGTTPTQTTTLNQCDVWSLFVTQATSTPAAPAWKVFGAQTAAFQ